MSDTPVPEPEAPAQDLPPVPGLSFSGAITKVSDTLRPQSVCIIGIHKVGKTTLAATASLIPQLVAAGKKVLIMESESGTASIAKDFPDVDMMKFATFSGFNRAFNELLTIDHEYGVVIIDTFDKFHEYGVHTFVDGAANTQAGWGQLKTWTSDFVWRAHKSPILFIFLIHEMDDKNEKTGAVTTTFKLQGSSKNDIGQIFDIIGRLTVRKNLETKKNERYLQLAPADGQVTGSRYESILPDEMANPTLPEIFDLILNNSTTK